ncbi:related to retrotransposon protein [Ustilago bromivora]|uniref:Related to retrotransposon protein n=1 Tax=Ustilago bromivora TaxID=307758 RepID=A0A1K0GXA5_9BASI|nr:related to retrotransposon protein [Ustilago bromivora]
MMDKSLNNKFERLITLMEAQLEFSRQAQRKEFLFAELDEQSSVNYEKYASPTGPRYLKPRVDPYNRPRMDPYGLEQEEDASATGDPNLSQSKPIATPFPKFNPRDVEIFILEAEAWFKFNQVHKQGQMMNHMGAQLEGNARKWWTSNICIDQA